MNAIDTAIAQLGSAAALAAVVGVSQPAVSYWRSRGTIPDAAACVAIERATNGAVTRQMLRPDDWRLIWPELSEQNPAQPITSQALAAIKEVAPT